MFDEQTKFHWNNISIIATVLGAIMLHTQQQWRRLRLNQGWRWITPADSCRHHSDTLLRPGDKLRQRQPGGLITAIKSWTSTYWSAVQATPWLCLREWVDFLQYFGKTSRKIFLAWFASKLVIHCLDCICIPGSSGWFSTIRKYSSLRNALGWALRSAISCLSGTSSQGLQTIRVDKHNQISYSHTNHTKL